MLLQFTEVFLLVQSYKLPNMCSPVQVQHSWWEVRPIRVAVSRCTWMAIGEQCVTPTWLTEMPVSSVDSWDLGIRCKLHSLTARHSLLINIQYVHSFNNCYLQTVKLALHCGTRTLGLVLVYSTLNVLAAMAMKILCWSAEVENISLVIVTMAMRPGWCVLYLRVSLFYLGFKSWLLYLHVYLF